jgi:GNAT superfamily N-acetyltransferase
VIRTAISADAYAFAEVITAAQSTWIEWAGEALTPYDVAELTVTWRARLEDPTTIAHISVTGGRITAVAAAGPEAASFQPSRLESTSAHLSTLFALPETHGDGSTQALHDAVLAELAARGYQTVRLWVPAGAQRARRFYERNGWAATGATTLFAGLERVEMRRSC